VELPPKSLDKGYGASSTRLLQKLHREWLRDGAGSSSITELDPAYVVFLAHLQVSDFAPRLATRFSAGGLWQTSSACSDGDPFSSCGSSFRARFNADYRHTVPAPAPLRSGRRLPYGIARSWQHHGPKPSRRRSMRAPSAISRKSHSARPPKRVDLSAAPIIVSVGRGSKEQDNLPDGRTRRSARR